jgi:hypothetical protein
MSMLFIFMLMLGLAMVVATLAVIMCVFMFRHKLHLAMVCFRRSLAGVTGVTQPGIIESARPSHLHASSRFAAQDFRLAERSWRSAQR